MDLDNLTAFLASYCPSRVVAARGNGDMLIDRYHLDTASGRFEAERTVIRKGRTRRMNFVKRLFGFPELRDWLLAAGFTSVAGYGEDEHLARSFTPPWCRSPTRPVLTGADAL